MRRINELSDEVQKYKNYYQVRTLQMNCLQKEVASLKTMLGSISGSGVNCSVMSEKVIESSDSKNEKGVGTSSLVGANAKADSGDQSEQQNEEMLADVYLLKEYIRCLSKRECLDFAKNCNIRFFYTENPAAKLSKKEKKKAVSALASNVISVIEKSSKEELKKMKIYIRQHF